MPYFYLVFRVWSKEVHRNVVQESSSLPKLALARWPVETSYRARSAQSSPGPPPTRTIPSTLGEETAAFYPLASPSLILLASWPLDRQALPVLLSKGPTGWRSWRPPPREAATRVACKSGLAIKLEASGSRHQPRLRERGGGIPPTTAVTSQQPAFQPQPAAALLHKA